MTLDEKLLREKIERLMRESHENARFMLMLKISKSADKEFYQEAIEVYRKLIGALALLSLYKEYFGDRYADSEKSLRKFSETYENMFLGSIEGYINLTSELKETLGKLRTK